MTQPKDNMTQAKPGTPCEEPPLGSGGAPVGEEPAEHPDAIELVDEDFDPEGWMTERESYWLDLPRADPPTRLAWLRHRVREAFRALSERHASPWRKPRFPEEDWIAASEQALGPLPRPGHKDEPQARSAQPNAQEPARKPQAYSPANERMEPAGRSHPTPRAWLA